MFRSLSLFLLLGLSLLAPAQTPQDAAIPLVITAGITPPAVLLSWPNPTPSDLILRRRVKGAAGNTWVELVNVQGTLMDGYYDATVSATEVYEYALEKKNGNVTAYGFGFANFLTPEIDYLGKLLVFIDSTSADALGTDLAAFKNGLRGEGWQIIPFKTGPSTSVQWVKNQIIAAYNADPANVRAVLLLGSVPVPYCGSLARDNQPDHAGAWPCDAYYGDLNGVWTDQVVNVTNTARPANRNVPGDGKFDQNTIPTAVELPVGRLDFRRLSAGAFGLPPVELLRHYLLKNLQYRSGQWKAPNQALVDDHLGWSNGEAFAADGYRNAYPITGATQVATGDLTAQTNPDRYLMAFGAGANGTYTGATGLGTSAQIANDTINAVFLGLFGQYFGDWDYETNPFMPAFLAARGGVLACAWMGRPHWFLHGLASGESLGYCLKETQNAQYNPAYGDSNAESGTHVSLLGDPTLRGIVVPSVTNLTAQSNCTKVNLHWSQPADPDILGYIVYRSQHLDGPYTRVSSNLGRQSAWEDLSPVADTLFYAVRALKLIATPGGGAFYQTSSSPIAQVIFVPGTGPTAIALGGLINCNNPSLTLGTNFQPPTSTYLWYHPNGQALGGPLATVGGVYTVVVTAPNGCTVAAYATVYQDTLLPVVDFPSVITLDCANPAFHYTIPSLGPAFQFLANGVAVQQGQTLALGQATTLQLYSSENGCSDQYQATVEQDFQIPYFVIQGGGATISCAQPEATLSVVVGIGESPSYGWSNGANTPAITVQSAGTYCCTVTTANGCSNTACAIINPGTNTFGGAIQSLDDLCAATEKRLDVQIQGGAPPFQYQWSNGSTAPEVVLPVGFSGTICITVTEANGCTASLCRAISPGVSMLALTDKPSSPTSSDGAIDLLITAGIPPFQFHWSNGATTEDLFNLTSNTYTVTVTDASGCTAVLSIPLITTSGVSVAPDEALQLKVLPNPGTGLFLLKVDLPAPETYRVAVIDVQGRIVWVTEAEEQELPMDLGALPPGLFTVSVQGATFNAALYLIKR